MIYYTETEAIYKKFAFDLHEILAEYQDNVGTFPDYVIKELGNSHGFANAVVWLCSEMVAQELTCGVYEDETA